MSQASVVQLSMDGLATKKYECVSEGGQGFARTHSPGTETKYGLLRLLEGQVRCDLIHSREDLE